MDYYSSETELRLAVEKHLGCKLTDPEWIRVSPAPDIHEPYGNAELKDVLKKLQRRRTKAKGKSKVNSTPAAVRSHLIPPSLQKLVRGLRTDLFGDSGPPFNDITAAVSWVRSVADAETGEADDFFDGSGRLALLAVPENGIVTHVPTHKNGKLRKVYTIAQFIASDLDCDAAQATGYVLTDIPPWVSPLTVSMQTTWHYDRPASGKIVITIREPVSETTLLEYYRLAKQRLWKRTRSVKTFTKKDDTLARFAIPLLRSRRQISKAMMQTWNRAHPEWRFDEMDTRAFRLAIERAIKKVYPPVVLP